MSVVVTKPKAVTINVREKARDWLSPVNLHWAGVAVLGLTCLYLLVQMGIAWQQAQSQNADALDRERIALTAAKIAAMPLEGLDVKLAKASGAADAFYMDRLPVSYSAVLAELGVLKTKNKVRLNGVQYAQKAVADDAAGHLTEVDMDASLTGDYKPLMLFINGLERDKMFFLISAVTLTGQQTGAVSLRLRLTTYLRGTPSDEERQRPEVGAGAAAGTGSAGSDLDDQINAMSKRRIGGSR